MRKIRRILGPALLTAGVVALVAASATAQRAARAIPLPAEDAAPVQRQAKKLTPAQLENVEARIALATGILNRLEGDAQSRRLQSGWRRGTLQTLLPLSLAALQQVEQRAHNLDALATATREAAEDPNLLGDPSADLVYTPITPCRFIDTRFYAAGPINGLRSFDVDLTGASYGGDAPCDLVASTGVANADVIAAIAMNVTIVGPAVAPGFLAIKPTAAAPVTSLLNWYEAGASVQVANQGVVRTFQGGGNEFVVQTSALTDVIVDFFGAFAEPEATALQTVEVSDSVACNAGLNCTNSSPTCPAGYALTGGGCQSGHFGVHLDSSQRSGTTWFCASDNTTGTNSTLLAEAVCARVPGR